jgi:hypothetical protein
MTTFQSEWEGFAEAFMPMIEVGTQQYHDMQLSFYSGALVLRQAVADGHLDAWSAEVIEFLAVFQKQLETAKAARKPLLDKRKRRRFEIDIIALHASGFSDEACAKVCQHIPEPIREMTITIFKTIMSLGVPSQVAFGLAVKLSKTVTSFVE